VSDQDEAPRGYAPGRHRIEDYGGGGFRFGDMSHKGSILALPGGVRAIAATRCQDIDDALIDLALADPNGIDLLIVGTGETLLPAPASLRNRLRAAGPQCKHYRRRPRRSGPGYSLDDHSSLARRGGEWY